MDIKRQQSNITQLFPTETDNTHKQISPALGDEPVLTSEDTKLLNEVLIDTSLINYDLHKLNLQLLRLIGIMKHQQDLDDMKRKQT